MTGKKLLQDRIDSIQQYCIDNHVDLSLDYGPDYEWRAYLDEDEVGAASCDFETLIESIEAELEL